MSLRQPTAKRFLTSSLVDGSPKHWYCRFIAARYASINTVYCVQHFTLSHTPGAVFQGRLLDNSANGANTERCVFGKLSLGEIFPTPSFWHGCLFRLGRYQPCHGKSAREGVIYIYLYSIRYAISRTIMGTSYIAKGQWQIRSVNGLLIVILIIVSQ